MTGWLPLFSWIQIDGGDVVAIIIGLLLALFIFVLSWIIGLVLIVISLTKFVKKEWSNKKVLLSLLFSILLMLVGPVARHVIDIISQG